MMWRFAVPFVLLIAIAAACNSRNTDNILLERISMTEARVIPKLVEWETDRGQDVNLEQDITSLLRDYAQYANAHHGDSVANQMLVKRAELLLGRGKAEAAERQWLDIVEGGADEALLSEALFRLGFIRETALMDTTGAMKAYAEVSRLFPESAWAKMALEASKWLTFSEENFIRAIGEGAREHRD